MPFLYPYDPLGTYPSNLITNELHTVTAPTSDEEANFIVPNAAPFFMDGIIFKTGPAPTDPVLIENVDYYLTHQFVEATQSLNKRIYGSITFVNRMFSGSVYLTYQTLGGPYTLDDYSVVTELTKSLYAIRVVTWGQIVGVPVAFPPVEHPHHTSDLTGMTEIVQQLQSLVGAVTANGGNVNTLVSTLTAHITGIAAHTKAQVGLSLLENYPPATQADIENIVAGRYITPPSLIYAIARYNTNGVHMTEATTTDKGIARLATVPEAENFVTPLSSVLITPETLVAALNVYDISRRVPVWDYWFTGDINKDPATFLGYGTWVRRTGFPVGYDATNSKFDDTANTGGSETVAITADNLPASFTATLLGRTGSGGSTSNQPGFSLATTDQGAVNATINTGSPNTALDILPPYFVMCIWQRTA